MALNSHLFCSQFCGAGIQGRLTQRLVSAPPGISWGSRSRRVHFQDGFFTLMPLSPYLTPRYGLGFIQHGSLREVNSLSHWLPSKRQEVDPDRLVNASPETRAMSLPSYLLDKAVIGPTQTQGERKKILLTDGGMTRSQNKMWKMRVPWPSLESPTGHILNIWISSTYPYFNSHYKLLYPFHDTCSEIM